RCRSLSPHAPHRCCCGCGRHSHTLRSDIPGPRTRIDGRRSCVDSALAHGCPCSLLHVPERENSAIGDGTLAETNILGGNRMTVERALRLMAGFFVLVSLALGYFVSPYWLLFTAFVGLNLFQSGLTNWCPAMFILRKLGLPDVGCASGG